MDAFWNSEETRDCLPDMIECCLRQCYDRRKELISEMIAIQKVEETLLKKLNEFKITEK